MKTLSLKLDEQIFSETEEVLEKLKKSRNRYINEALDYYNKLQKNMIIEEMLIKESKWVSEESMKVLKEFESMDDTHEAI